MVFERLKIGGGYIITPTEKNPRGCLYCADGKVRTLASYRPQKQDFSEGEKDKWNSAKKEYERLLAFNKYHLQQKKEDEVCRVIECPHEECPYHELDNVKSYAEYERTSRIGIGDISRLFSSWNKTR